MATDRITVQALFKRAYEGGGRLIGPHEIEWELHGDCANPVRREVSARKQQGFSITKYRHKPPRSAWSLEETFIDTSVHQPILTFNYGVDRLPPYAVYLTLRCRMCDNCLRQRQNMWAARAIVECNRAARTWFCTFTLDPFEQVKATYKAEQYAQRRRLGPLDALPYKQQLQLRHLYSGGELTKMWKRLRQAGHRLRYFSVLEAHKSGLPHYHALVHELGAPITKRTIQNEWTLGYSNVKLVEADDVPKRVWYVAKYLGKSKAARVRASLRYGNVVPSLDIVTRPVVLTEERGADADHQGEEFPIHVFERIHYPSFLETSDGFEEALSGSDDEYV